MGCGGSKSQRKQVVEPLQKSSSPLIFRPSTFIGKKIGEFQQHYEIEKQIGSGAFSKVFRCVDRRSGHFRAVKVIHKEGKLKMKQDLVNNINEINIVRQLDHPAILRIFEQYEDSRHFYIVMEYCAGGELFDKIMHKHRFSEQQVCQIIRQLLSAVAYCHGRNIIHRDLKPENILLEDKEDNISIKVADFGSSVIFEKEQKLSGCFGSVFYVAPEVLDGIYDEKCDIWSIGVIMYILLTGKAPFGGANDQEILQNIQQQAPLLTGKLFTNISQESIELVSQLLRKNPANRPSAVQALEHDWFLRHQVKTSHKGLTSALQELKNFNSNAKLRQAIRTFIASQLITYKDTKELKKAFQAIDTNGDGKIDREELLEAYTVIMGAVDAQTLVDNIMKQVDIDGNGYIDFSEFIEAGIKQDTLLSRKNLEIAFKAFDLDGSGSISAEELKEILLNGSTVQNELIDEIIKEVDDNGDGEVDLQEFMDIVNRRIGN